MSFVVVWDAHVAEEIDRTLLIVTEGYRRQIVDAVAEINEVLHKDALTAGESREAGIVRVVTVDPVTAHFRVEDRLRIARVLSVKIYG